METAIIISNNLRECKSTVQPHVHLKKPNKHYHTISMTGFKGPVCPDLVASTGKKKILQAVLIPVF